MKAKTLALTIFALTLACAMALLVGCSSGSSSSNTSSSSGSSDTSSSQTTSSSSSSSSTTTTTTSSWPENANTADVPRPTFSSAPISIIDSGGITAITYSGISSADSATYLQQLKDAGFTQVEANTEVSGTVSYVARNVNTKTHLSYSFSSYGGSLTVSLDRIGV